MAFAGSTLRPRRFSPPKFPACQRVAEHDPPPQDGPPGCPACLQGQLHGNRLFQLVRQHPDARSDLLHAAGVRPGDRGRQRVDAADADPDPATAAGYHGRTGVGALADHGAHQHPAGHPARRPSLQRQFQAGALLWRHECLRAAAQRHDWTAPVSYRQRPVRLLRRALAADLSSTDVHVPPLVRLVRPPLRSHPHRPGLRQRAPDRPDAQECQPGKSRCHRLHQQEPAQRRGGGIDGHAATTAPPLAGAEQPRTGTAGRGQRPRRHHHRPLQDLSPAGTVADPRPRRLPVTGAGNQLRHDDCRLRPARSRPGADRPDDRLLERFHLGPRPI
ncbi:hypothetical protein D3C78_985800 [compost metagenome]